MPPKSVINSEWWRNEKADTIYFVKNLCNWPSQTSSLMNLMISCCLSLYSSAVHHWPKQGNRFTSNEEARNGPGQYQLSWTLHFSRHVVGLHDLTNVTTAMGARYTSTLTTFYCTEFAPTNLTVCHPWRTLLLVEVIPSWMSSSQLQSNPTKTQYLALDTWYGSCSWTVGWRGEGFWTNACEGGLRWRLCVGELMRPQARIQECMVNKRSWCR